MSNIFLGTAINWGVNGVTMSGTAIGTFVMQDFEFQNTADVDETRDETGNLIQETVYNAGNAASFNYVVKGTGLANAITESTIPVIGTIVNISVCTQNPTLVFTNWRVKEPPVIKQSNKGKAMVTLKLVQHPGITAVSSA